MSRSQRGADQGYGRLRFKCPFGHRVGEVILQAPGASVLFNRGDGWTRVLVSDLDRTLSFACAQCAALGRRRDLQASSSKVLAKLAALDADPTHGTEDYVLGA